MLKFQQLTYTLVKIHINSVFLNPRAQYMMSDINFYLNTPIIPLEYIKIKIADIPEEIIFKFDLWETATPNVYVYIEIQKNMCWLQQAGISTRIIPKNWSK